MRITHIQNQVVAIYLGAITNTVDFQDSLETSADTHDHVIDQGAGGAMQGATVRASFGARDHDITLFQRDTHLQGEGIIKLAFGAFHSDTASRRSATFTPWGRATGKRPIRDTASSFTKLCTGLRRQRRAGERAVRSSHPWGWRGWQCPCPRAPRGSLPCR